MKLVDRHFITPPVGSVSDTKTPLSFLDIFWLGAKPVQRLFLYKHPSISITYFIQHILPSLKHSLSLALLHFFPVCGSLVFEPPSRPYIQYNQGNSVSITVVESVEDFDQYISREQGKLLNYTALTKLVPTLSSVDDTANDSLFAIQVTVFPNSGVSIGVTYKHVLGDGRSIMQFLKTWASLCRNSGSMSEDLVLPIVDRSIVPDPGGVLVDTFLKQLASIPPEFLEKREQTDVNEFKVRTTFYIKRSELQNMKKWILSQVVESENLHLSPFVLTCSLMWVCLVNSQTAAGKLHDDNDGDHSIFGFVIDCCDRYEYKSIVPSTYFGNCLSLGCFTLLKKHDLLLETGLVTAAKAIGKAIDDMVTKGPMKDPESWFSRTTETIKSLHDIIGVAGSPRLGAYDLDFGWGMPEKVEVVSIADPMSVSLAEFKDDAGGVEASLVLGLSRMNAFIALFEKSKARYCV